jgi:hypothetical protein
LIDVSKALNASIIKAITSEMSVNFYEIAWRKSRQGVTLISYLADVDLSCNGECPSRTCRYIKVRRCMLSAPSGLKQYALPKGWNLPTNPHELTTYRINTIFASVRT